MKPDAACAACLFKWVYERAGVSASREQHFPLIRSILEVLSREFYSATNLGLMTNRIIEAVDEFMLQSAPHYERFRFKSNQFAKELLPSAAHFIDKGQTDQEKFIRACCLAAAGNIAPLGGPTESFKFQEVIDLLAGKNPFPIIFGDVFALTKKYKHILYITDNAGEIGFDTFLISRLKEMGLRVTLFVKEEHFFEDATMKDASFFNLDQSADNILSAKGLFMPSRSPSPLTDVLHQCDLVISKGTGNYEALQGEVDGKPIIYMLKVKCKPIAMKIGADIGTFIVKIDNKKEI